jgi:O-antigen/teichoic acid export membrane protein
MSPRPLSPRAAALVEQGLVSGANFLLMLAFVRQLAPADWGVFAFAHALALFLQGFQRAGVTLPMIALASLPGAGWDAARGLWLRLNCTGAGLASLATLGVLVLVAAGQATALATEWWRPAEGLAGSAPAWWVTALGLAAALVLPLWLHEFTRRAAVQEGRYGVLAAQGAVYALVLGLGAAAGAGLGLPAGWPPAVAPAVTLALAGLAATGVYRVAAGQPVLARPGWQLPPAVQRAWGPFTGWSAGAHLAYSGYNFGVLALLAALAGPVAVAVFHAMRLLVQPVAVLVAALDSIDKPRAARALLQGAPALRRVLWRSLRAIGLPALPYLLLLALAGEVLLPLVFGPAYAGQGAALLAACALSLVSVVSQPLESGLYVARRTRALCLGRAGAALVGLLAALASVPLYGAAGALGAMALGYASAAAAAAWTLARLK